MKSFLVFILLSDVCFSGGQQRIEEYQQILLRLPFPSFYNNHNKSCCKLYPGGCYKLLDSAGFTCDLLRGRVTKTERDGWVEFKISNVRFVDGGYYRCAVLGIQSHIYRDFYVEVLEVSRHHSQPQPPLTEAITAPSSSSAPTDVTGPALAQDHSGTAGVSWSFGLPLVVIVSIAVMISVTSVIGVVCYRLRAKHRSDQYGEILCESVKREAPPQDLGGIVYTTVDFRAHEKPDQLYANLTMHRGAAGAPGAEHDGTVEYSTLAVHQ
ncbi:uncharacterized protein LOC115408428 [Salarias fasciatus]|uniref:uncharacterized protein LOC115408428 n=1 Tax=Salarias fasciatus TaxID=181472 RepID=UPI00117653BA|nr:uncharacterized protein LOC115408428 [Salarias fasciatus]